MPRIALPLILGLGLLLALPTAAQDRPTSATDVIKAELDAVFATLGDSIDKQVKIVDIGSDTDVAGGILHRGELESEGDVGAIVHHQVTEVYYILDGSGTLVTGGPIDAAREFPSDSGVVAELVGPSAIGTFDSGTSRPVSAGDVVVIPAGVPHGFSQIAAAGVSCLSIRVDPDQVLPAVWVSPVISR